MQEMASLYVNDKKIKEVSPIENLTGLFPPTLIFVSSTEVLLDDGKALYNKLKAQQNNVKLSIYENQKHVWPFEDIHTEAAQNAMTKIQDFISALSKTYKVFNSTTKKAVNLGMS